MIIPKAIKLCNAKPTNVLIQSSATASDMTRSWWTLSWQIMATLWSWAWKVKRGNRQPHQVKIELNRWGKIYRFPIFYFAFKCWHFDSGRHPYKIYLNGIFYCHHLKARLGPYFASCLYINFNLVCSHSSRNKWGWP